MRSGTTTSILIGGLLCGAIGCGKGDKAAAGGGASTTGSGIAVTTGTAMATGKPTPPPLPPLTGPVIEVAGFVAPKPAHWIFGDEATDPVATDLKIRASIPAGAKWLVPENITAAGVSSANIIVTSADGNFEGQSCASLGAALGQAMAGARLIGTKDMMIAGGDGCEVHLDLPGTGEQRQYFGTTGKKLIVIACTGNETGDAKLDAACAEILAGVRVAP